MSSSNEASVALFRQLKPLCVAVSNRALRVRPTNNPNEFVIDLSNLESALAGVPYKTAISPAIADYIFAPLSHILRRKDEWPDRVLEITLSCVEMLLATAWATKLSSQMFEQFTFMLIVITEGKGRIVSEELKTGSIGCLKALFESAKQNIVVDATFKETIRDAKLRPLLGHTATVLLDNIKGKTYRMPIFKLEALSSLSILYTSLLDDGQIVASFLPLTVSTLSRSLSASPATTHNRILVALLNLLCETLCLVMDDNLEHASPPPQINEMYFTEMTESWYKATKNQVKIALEGFFPFIRSHQHSLVRQAALKFSEQSLSHCSRTLDICQSLFFETILSLQHDSFPAVRERAITALQRLKKNPALTSVIRGSVEESLYTWCIALPRTMTSNDDSAKVHLLQRITSAIDYFSSDTSSISSSLETLLKAIQDISIFDSDRVSTKLIQPSQSLLVAFQDASQDSSALSLLYSEDEKVITSLQELMQTIGKTPFAVQMIDRLVVNASINSPQRASDAWIALNILKGNSNPESQVDELYSLATDWLFESNSSFSAVDVPPPTLMISLDIISFTASVTKLAFRQNLMHVLYPTLALLSHGSAQVKSAARSTLNTIATATGYDNLQCLILGNSDYLVNSVALKLNVFDVSVQVLATLYTVTKIAGPRVVPYMDDIWGSLFDIIDRFHGYEKLVTGVFAVMTGIVEVVSTSAHFPHPTEQPPEVSSHKAVCTEIQELIETIQQNEDYLPPKHDELTLPKPAPLPPKTASLLQNLARKSVLLTSHPSPHLRFNLIHLLRKALPLLAIPTVVKDGEQDPFLPLLAQEVWPAVCSKLTDKEAWVVNAALETIAELVAIEGDFLGAKVEKDVWPALKGILSPKATGKGKEVVLYQREPAVKALCAIIKYSDQKPTVFDEMLRTSWPWIQGGGDQGSALRRQFERKNGDAVWLVEHFNPDTLPEFPVAKGYFRPIRYE
jgi:TELO2-interacting protein 1